MRTVIRVVSIVAFLLSIAWLAYNPGFKSALAALTTLAALLSSFLVKKSEAKQSQKVSSGSIGVQAGGNINVDKIER
jgi:hypothetical protein